MKALVAVALLCAVAHARNGYRDDAIDRPTDTGIALVDGLWHDDRFAPGAGWHLYHYIAGADGPVAFQMRAAPHGEVWSYLRVVDVDSGPHVESWASVANRRTNLCELIVEVARGHHYDVIATSQQNAVLEPGEKQVVRGEYTIAALPIEHREPAVALVEAPVAAPPSSKIQPNDLSILYPLARAKLAATSLIPAAIYARAFAHPLGGTPDAPRLAQLRMVGFRLDPFELRLRVVFQRVSGSGRRVTAADDAVHVFFSLTRAQLDAAVAQIVALRHAYAGDQDLGPLAVHPLLAAHAPLADALDDLVAHLAQPERLARITIAVPSAMGHAWNFSGVDLVDGAPVAMTIPGVSGPVSSFFTGFGGQAPMLAPAPRVASVDDLFRTATAAARIEDPAVHSTETIDCASCHVAHALATGGARDPNMHMFGYRGATPSIQPRTIRETTAAAEFLTR